MSRPIALNAKPVAATIRDGLGFILTTTDPLWKEQEYVLYHINDAHRKLRA